MEISKVPMKSALDYISSYVCANQMLQIKPILKIKYLNALTEPIILNDYFFLRAIINLIYNFDIFQNVAGSSLVRK